MIALALAGGCKANDAAAPRRAGTTPSVVPTPETTVHPFYETFPELLDIELQGVGALRCPSGDGSGSESSEWDTASVRKQYAEHPDAFATDPVGAVILRLERGQADPQRLQGMRQWLRVDGDEVVLPVGPDDTTGHYVLRAYIDVVDSEVHILHGITSCNFVWRPLPTP